MDMNQVKEMLISLQKKLEILEERVNELSEPLELMYRPPERGEHVNIVEFLNEIDSRLKKLEN